MATFPTLKTGAVAQYPARKTTSFSTCVMRFVDGNEQRFREYGRPLRSWIVELDQLDDSEMARIEEFFASQQGVLGVFTFVDPWDGIEYPECSLQDPELTLTFLREGKGQAMLRINENRV
ncbi:MAG: DUF2460 domain-containing protein [Bryobacteraceae bacterium]|nr:DUF2460 domain-containing protein [Bryobacteraceae bacterium]